MRLRVTLAACGTLMFPASMSRSELHPNNSLPDLAHTLEEHLLAGFPPDLALDLVLNELVAQAAEATHAGGAALALPRGDSMVCRAATGQLAPGLGVTLDGTHGLSGACLQTGQPQISLDTELDPRVDHDASRRMGIRSIFIVPVIRLHHDDESALASDRPGTGNLRDAPDRDVMGILEVFAAEPNAFPESAQNLLQSFAEECARIRIAATELSWHKPAEGLASDDFMPPPLPQSDYMWPDFAEPQAPVFDADAFSHSNLVDEHATETALPDAMLHDTAMHDAVLPDATMHPAADDAAAHVSSSDAPEFARHLPVTSKYEGWTLGLGALAILAIIAVSFLIGSRVGWLNAPASNIASSLRPTSVSGNGTPCAQSADPACSPAAAKSRVGNSASPNGQKSADKKLVKSSDRSNTKTATPAESGDLVVYEKGKVVFRMKPAPAGTEIAADRKPKTTVDSVAQNSTDTNDASSVVEASSTTKIPTSKSVRLSPQEAESRLLSRVEPRLPPETVAARRAGTVVLEVQVAEDGTISNLRTLSGDPILANAASEAVRNWRYQPYRQGNQPSQFQTDVTLNFNPPK